MNIFKYFVRNFRANRQSYLINMLSLVPGLACCLLILLWVIFEIGTDRFYPNTDRIATVCGYHEGQNTFRGAPPAVAPTVKEEMPEVEAATRVVWLHNTVKWETKTFGVLSSGVDADIFKIFGLKLAEGEAFKDDELDKCVITRKTARKIFGEVSPIGKFLEFDTLQYVVSGVLEDLPKNNLLRLEVLLPIQRSKGLTAWYNNGYETYVLLKDAAGFESFKAKIKDRAMQARPENRLYLSAGQLKDRYLYRFNMIKNVRLMGMIALLVLAIACINFVNLTIAGFMKNSFQTGVRKVVGATRGGLIRANYVNTFLLVMLSFALAFALAIMILPWFNTLIGRNFVMSDFLNPTVIIAGVAVMVTTALLAGFYPSLYMASLEPLKVLKSRNALSGRKNYFRNTLVVAQFAVAIVLIISTFVISKQIRMFQQMDLGYARDEVVFVECSGELVKNIQVLRSELKKEPAIEAVSISQHIPTSISWNGTGWTWEGKDPAAAPLITFGFVDEDWAKVLNVKFKEGGAFDENSNAYTVVINDRLAEAMGEGEHVGKYIEQDTLYRIIGVLDNFMFNNFKAEPELLVLHPIKDIVVADGFGSACVMVRAQGSQLAKVCELMKKKATELNGGESVAVQFLSDKTEDILYAEKQSTQMVSFFTILAILISCLGLFGLATLMMEQKRKEIGVRRVNGAKVSEIVWSLNLSFIRPIAIAFVIACPVAWYVMSDWLEGYLQRTTLSWWIFVSAGIAVTVVAVLTLVWSSVKAATANPVESLKSE